MSNEQHDDNTLRVGASTPAQSLASAIANAIYDAPDRKVTLRAVGAGAVNQAVKAIAIARGYAAPKGFNLCAVPAFATIQSRDGDISAVVFTVTTH